MSKENTLTVEVYEKYAEKYIENSRNKELEDISLAREKEKKLLDFFLKSFSNLPSNSKILEIGSGGGENADLLKKSGFDIIASDASNLFVNEMKMKNLNAIRFNALNDDFICDISGILCWRVFVHFTLEDARKVLEKSYKAINNGGKMIFNAMNREYYKIDSEWKDMSGTYHMGVERFYQYYKKDELDKIIKDTGFHINQFFMEGGKEENKWLVYVIEK